MEYVEKIKKQKSIENERLNIIYRICDMKNASSSTKRCFDVSKNTLIKKCLNSVIFQDYSNVSRYFNKNR